MVQCATLVQCANGSLDYGDGMEVYGVWLAMVPEKGRKTEAVSKAEMQEAGNL